MCMPGDGPSSMGRRGAMRVGVCSHGLAEDGKWEEWGEAGDIPECRTLLAGLACPARGGGQVGRRWPVVAVALWLGHPS
jgi:hypothetical protein